MVQLILRLLKFNEQLLTSLLLWQVERRRRRSQRLAGSVSVPAIAKILRGDLDELPEQTRRPRRHKSESSLLLQKSDDDSGYDRELSGQTIETHSSFPVAPLASGTSSRPGRSSSISDLAAHMGINVPTSGLLRWERGLTDKGDDEDVPF